MIPLTSTRSPTLIRPAYRSAVLADSPIGYWRLGEASGITAVDATGNGHDGTYTPNAAGAWTGGTLGMAGALSNNTAANFTGSGLVDVPDHAALRFTTAFTLEAWVNPADRSAFHMIIAKGISGSRNYDFDIAPTGVLRLFISSGGSFVGFNGLGAVPTSQWTHVVTTYDGATMSLYINGVLDNSTPASGTADTTTDDMAIGCLGTTGGNNMVGGIDEAAVYNHALSATRIAAHYNATR